MFKNPKVRPLQSTSLPAGQAQFKPQFSCREFVASSLSRMVFQTCAAPLGGHGPSSPSPPSLSFPIRVPFCHEQRSVPAREKTDGTTSDFRVSTFAQFPHPLLPSFLPSFLPSPVCFCSQIKRLWIAIYSGDGEQNMHG